ncbi:UNVERIFIED_ORG: flagellar FliL protein [Paraburkholderia sediminicola]|jgi:flagellar protein FliL|uniref:flagellar basal body-associated protein FliL n=1 Tax=Paraburkholderia TaxID=1822464 RepID=UPI00190AD63F|nr:MULTISPECIES: flagellar basal body-associated protein FliL [Paraburkholderia]MCP2086378.1 flagellar FliL protein [Paraburkholderia sediminicola]MBK3841624.1 flagellar basal body-associated protein FliL [Paraburkholderia aspalathi]MCX4142201.1 flagellar basal body-associated protein FliL [Paraburkholderia aspalathi]MDN7174881.1 flagellar basal body-associated protein FliL [Paraburkholderia sp. SEWSISQ10-3 4]MDQ6504522.1 flagellar basal body-associated protein FliL [Paraburkholderia aspalathi
MATTTANQQAAPASPGPLKRIILIVLIAIIAAGAAGAGVWFFMSKRTPAPASATTAAAPAPLPVPLFFPLESMTVNLQSDDGQQHFLRIGLTLKLNDPKTQQELSDHMPEVRSRILLALSNKHPEELAPLEGKRALATELQTLIEEPTDKGAAPIHVQDVLFTEFVVQ